jgi:prolyl-tRNA synthetase
VPVRLELGPRDLADGSALMSTRLGEGKSPVSLDSAPARLEFELNAMQGLLLQRATDFRDSHTATVNSWAEFAEAVKTGWAMAFHCGQPECEAGIKAATSATPRCIPAEGAAEEGICVRCNQKSAYGKRLIFGRAY